MITMEEISNFINIKPNAGLFVAFPASVSFEHASTPITKGHKYLLRINLGYKEGDWNVKR